MLVYFAHPIDQAHAPMKEINAIRGRLREAGVTFFRPAGGFNLSQPTRVDLQTIDRINRFALAAADALVAWLPSGVATLGVPAEIEEALATNTPTLILTDAVLRATSVQIQGWEARGAIVTEWGSIADSDWAKRPDELLMLLRTRPADELARFDDMLPVSAPPLEVQLDPAAKAPSRAYQDDAGLDLATIEPVRLMCGEYKLVRTGVRAAVPSGWWGMITGRSSTWAKYRCDVRLAVIDAGYRGELMIGIENRGAHPIEFESGTRLAQYVLIPTFPGLVQQVDELPPAHRGENGYGSSGH